MQADALHLVLAAVPAALVAGWIAARLARRSLTHGLLVDHPSPRRVHQRAVPRVGGIALVTGLGLVSLGLLAGGAGDASSWWRWLVPLVAFFLTGLVDDAFSPPPALKLGLQLLATALALLVGLRWGGTGHALWTGLWILGVLQVMNFLDGIDLILGAVAGVFLAAAVGAGVGPGGGLLYAAALGATIGVLLLNVPPARVFLGDSGSHTLGFLVGATTLGVEGSSPATLPWPLAVAMLLPATADILMGFVSKRRLGYGFVAAHREHLYQRLTRSSPTHAPVAARYALLTMASLAVVALLEPPFGRTAALLAAAGLTLVHIAAGRRRVRRAAAGRAAGGN